MNILFSVIQVLLALHTAMGAVWKLFNSEQTMPSLNAIPHGVWLAMGVVELLCGVGLILATFSKPRAILAPIAAIYIAAEMLIFCGLEINSGNPNYGSVTYWLVVAAVCAFIAYGGFARKRF